jgi:glutamine amidotransferase
MARTLGRVAGMMQEAGCRQPLRFAAAHSGGRTLTCYRWSSDRRPPTLYVREEADRVVVSEPLDRAGPGWRPIPPNHALVARAGSAARTVPFEVLALADAATCVPLRNVADGP